MLTEVITLAAETGTTLPGSADFFLSLLNVPVFGALVWALLTGKIVSGKEHERVVQERDRERDERIKAQEALTDKALPLILTSQQVMKEASDLIQHLSRKY